MFLSYGWILLGHACAVRPFGDAWRMAVTSPEREGASTSNFPTQHPTKYFFYFSSFWVSSS